ncbi:MAG TPA: lytic transglycosylase domain-containing protein, partial [Vicinamibacteria bacterium]|nr:lytic transglycosylase domain-containing protein [Vicinamibacteria bacterium]
LAAAGHPLRDLALYYLARTAEAEGRVADAGRYREELIGLGGPRRSDAQAEQAALLASRRDADGLAAWADRAGATAPRSLRRRMDADLVSLWLARDDKARAIATASDLLRESTGDDPADRVSLALDRPELLALLGADDRVRVAEAARVHRRFDRAVALLRAGLQEAPQKRDDLLFSIGRAHYVAEDYAAAERAYLEGTSTTDAEARTRFLYHAARSAQLRGDDKQAEKLLLRTVAEAPRPQARAARGRRTRRPRPPAEASRLCLARLQLVRLLTSQERFTAAEPHLAALRASRCPAEAGEAAVAYASAAVVHGKAASARTELARTPAKGASEAEGDYWAARALETIDPQRSLEAHLALLRPATISPFARFAQARLEGPLARRARERAVLLPAEAEAARARGDLDAARRLMTDAALLATPGDAPAARERLRDLYRQLPAYASGLALQALSPPRLADAAAPATRTDALLAMGLFDDAAEGVGDRYAGASAEMALTRAALLQRDGRARASIRAAEGIVAALPTEFLPELLPGQVRDLLYPRHYLALIQEDALRFGADPLLVLAIMREESRFDTRARSAAAARGLLQIVLTTARAVGRDLGLPELEGEDLYDPALVIPLGSKYLADLQRDFGGNLMKAAAAYNAGPRQAQLWSRLAPGSADDAFFASISFAETRRYVAQVLSSYDRYRALTAPPAKQAGSNGTAGGAARAR